MEEPDFRFSFPDARKLTGNINPQEIMSVFNNSRSVLNSVNHYPGVHYYMIGFGSKKRFLQLLLNYRDDTINFVEAELASESAIVQDYCRK